MEHCCCCCCVAAVVSNSVQPQRRQPTRLPRPWDSPGKNTGVGCHVLLQCMKVKRESEVAQSCPTLCDPMDCSLPGSSVRGIFQVRVLEWGATAFSYITMLPHIKYIFIHKYLWTVGWVYLWNNFLEPPSNCVCTLKTNSRCNEDALQLSPGQTNK